MSEKFFNAHEEVFVCYFKELTKKYECATIATKKYEGIILYIYGKYFNPYCNDLGKFSIIFGEEDPVGVFFNCVFHHDDIMRIAASKIKRHFWDYQNTERARVQSGNKRPQIIKRKDVEEKKLALSRNLRNENEKLACECDEGQELFMEKNRRNEAEKRRLELNQNLQNEEERLVFESEERQELLIARFRSIRDYLVGEKEVDSRCRASIQQLQILKGHAEGKNIVLFSYFRGLPVYNIFTLFEFDDEKLFLWYGRMSPKKVLFFKSKPRLSIICLRDSDEKLLSKRDFFLTNLNYISRQIAFDADTLTLQDFSVDLVNTTRREYRFDLCKDECKVLISHQNEKLKLYGYVTNINAGGARIILKNSYRITERKLRNITRIVTQIEYKKHIVPFSSKIVGKGRISIKKVEHYWISVSFEVGPVEAKKVRKMVASIIRDIRNGRPK